MYANASKMRITQKESVNAMKTSIMTAHNALNAVHINTEKTENFATSFKMQTLKEMDALMDSEEIQVKLTNNVINVGS